MSGPGSHYDTLGVGPDATPMEIRDAYRRLARRHHPDRAEADASSMPDINEAYRVLGDPARRAAYDSTSRRPVPLVPTSTAPRRPVRYPADLAPARVPWRLMAAMFAIGVAIVLVGAALYEPSGPQAPDSFIEPGSCVTIEANGDAREVTCTGDDPLVVEALVPLGDRCPDGTAGHRDRQGRGLACVRSLP